MTSVIRTNSLSTTPSLGSVKMYIETNGNSMGNMILREYLICDAMNCHEFIPRTSINAIHFNQFGF